MTGKLTMDKTIFGEDFAFLQSVAGDDSVPKQTIPAPSMVHYRSGIRAVVDEAVYPDAEEFWTDLSAAYADGGPRGWPPRAARTCSSTTRRWPT